MNSGKAALIEDAGTTSYLDSAEVSALQIAPLAAGGGPSKPGEQPGEPMACQGSRDQPCTPKPIKPEGEPMACQGKCR